MTVPTSNRARASAATTSPRSKKNWVTPAVVRINSVDAENGANPFITDGAFTLS